MKNKVETPTQPPLAARSIAHSRFASRKLVMPDQINPNGTLFGGVLMSWIDKVAYMSAQRHSERPCVVTVKVEELSFEKPIHIGDHVVLESGLIAVGRTSMDLLVRVYRENGCRGGREEATRAYLTFVALDEIGAPAVVPRLLADNAEDARDFEEGIRRRGVREQLKAFADPPRWPRPRFELRM